jgi:hypothetical protein
MLQTEILVETNQYLSSRSASPSEPEAEPEPRDEPSEPETHDGPDDDSNRLPENVPDDWLDPKPFDPAGR